MTGINQLPEYFAAAFLDGRRYQTVVDARKEAAAFLGETVTPGSAIAKLIDEAIEAGIVRAARSIVQQSESPQLTYDRLVELHGQQPNLSVRSSTSVKQQAYSTPIPIAYFAAILAGVTADTSVYEPTAGHGALLLNADPSKVTVNELNPERASDLRSQGYTVTEQDASVYLPEHLHDVVIANPPFGRVRGPDGQPRRFELPGNRKGTSQIDQAIALQALGAMKDEGRAVLILGSKPGRDEAERSDAYNTLESRGFFYALYQNYNVVQHFSISGELYRKQGAGWPLDVIVIEGRGKSELPLPAAQVPRIYESFAELREVLDDAINRNTQLQGIPDLSGSVGAAGGRGSEPIPSPDSSELNNDDIQAVPGSNELSDGVDDAGLAGEYWGFSRSSPRDVGGKPQKIAPNPGSTEPARRIGGAESDVDMGEQLGGESSGIQRGMDERVPVDQSRGEFSSADNPVIPATNGIDGAARRDLHRAIPDGTESGLRVSDNRQLAEGTDMPQELNTPYMPRSKGRSPGTLIPNNMAVSAQSALNGLEQRHGDIDEFVMGRLGFTSTEQLWNVLYAEQIDSLALAFDQRNKGKIFLNGDQTGNGKGRFGAACIVDAQRQGFIPIFVTQKPNLYSSMMTDLADIGYRDIQPFMTNANLDLKLEDGRKVKTGQLADQTAEMRQIAEKGLGGYDAIFTTYNQLQTVSGKETDRREFLRAIASQAVFIFDESHEAGGSVSEGSWKIKGAAPNRANYVRKLVDQSAGAVFMSATATKNPAVMDLYARRTDAVHAVASMENLEQTLKAGGIGCIPTLR